MLKDLLFRHAIHFANDAIVLGDEAGLVVATNDRAVQMYGYSESEFSGLPVSALRSEAARARQSEDMAAAAASGKTYTTEHRRKDGSVFPVEISMRSMDVAGKTYWLGIQRDISERVAAERHIAMLQRLYLAIHSANRAVILAVSESEMLERICATCTEYGFALAWVGMEREGVVRPVVVSGFGAEYIQGLRITTDPDDPSSHGATGTAFRTQTKAIFNDFMADPRNWPWRERAEHFGWASSAAFPLFRLGKCVGALTLYSGTIGQFGPEEIDVLTELAENISFALDRFAADSRRRTLEVEVEKSEARFRFLFENMVEGFAYCRLMFQDGRPSDFTYLSVNRAFETLTGLKDVVGRVVSEVIPGIHQTNPELLESYASVALGGAPIKMESYLPELDIWFSVSAYGAGDNCFVAVFDNITERKRAQETIQRTVDELSRSNAELERFAYVASHDLQEPVRSVVSYAQLLARRYGGQLGPDGDEYIRFLVEGAKRMGALVRDLLSYSRVGAAKRPFGLVDMGAVVAAAQANLAAAIAESGTVVTVGHLAHVIGDDALLIELVQNLLHNAIKFQRDGVPPAIRVECVTLGGEKVFMVRDNGIGIDGEYFEKIFVMFQRLHTQDHYAGTGIGLAVCKKIVENHGGRIWVESAPGQGASFFFTLAITSD